MSFAHTKTQLVTCHVCQTQTSRARQGGADTQICDRCQETYTWLCEHVARTRGIRQELVLLESSLANDLIPDSFDLIETVVEMEKRFGVTISYEQALELETVADAIRYIANQQANS